MNEKSLDWDDFVKKLSPPTIPKNKIDKEWLIAYGVFGFQQKLKPVS